MPPDNRTMAHSHLTTSLCTGAGTEGRQSSDLSFFFFLPRIPISCLDFKASTPLWLSLALRVNQRPAQQTVDGAAI